MVDAACVPKRESTYRDPFFDSAEYRDAQKRLRANLKQLRTERGWTQEDAAKHCGGMSYQHFSQFESGRTNITLVTLCRIAKGFGVDVAALLSANSEKKSAAR